MPRKAKPVSGVFEKTEGSGIFYVRYRVNGKLVRKKIGTRSQAVDYLNKVKHIRSSGDGVVPVTAKAPARTSAEIRELMEGSTLGELADGLLQQIISDPERYKDQHNRL
jgi:hypothetical protein